MVKTKNIQITIGRTAKNMAVSKEQMDVSKAIKAIPLEVLKTYITTGTLEIKNEDTFYKVLQICTTPESFKEFFGEDYQASQDSTRRPLKTVKTNSNLSWMDKAKSTEDMYAMAVQEGDKKIAADERFKHLEFTCQIRLNYTDWCTPELMEYLSLDKKKALEELRAAAYPLQVNFLEDLSSITNPNGEKEVWAVPYITFAQIDDWHGTTMPDNGQNKRVFAFFQDSNSEIHLIYGNIVDVFRIEDYNSIAELQSSMNQRTKELCAKINDDGAVSRKEYFYNIKVGKGVYALVRNIGSEYALYYGWEKKDIKMANRWFKTKNMTRFRTEKGTYSMKMYWDSVPEERKEIIREKGKEAIAKLNYALYNTNGLIKGKSQGEDFYYKDGDVFPDIQ